jgi:hypothetical protein
VEEIVSTIWQLLLRQIDLSSWLGPIANQSQTTSENVQQICEILTADLRREVLDRTDDREVSGAYIRREINPPNYHYEDDEDIV